MTRATWVLGYATLLYHKDDGTTNSIVDTYSMYGGVSQLYLTGDGSVVGIEPSTRRVDKFNLNTNSVTSSNLANTSTYTVAELSGYVEDASGNALVAWSYNSNGGTNQAISVDEIAAGTGVRTNLLFEESVSTGSNGPNLYPFGYMIDRSIADRNVYIPICRSGAATCFSGNVVPDIWIYKAELSGFGAALRNDYDRNDYESTELEYVAMGDSYSSGEGVEPFLFGTAIDNENECHRSEEAYPLLLEESSSLGLNLTAFVACSGAVTANITTLGQWNEPAQLSALSESTDVVTLTVGGNDAGFKEYLIGCVAYYCGPGTLSYGAMMTLSQSTSFKANLVSTYEAILQAAGNAEVFVMDYPYVLAETAFNCSGANSIGTRSVQDSINNAIKTAAEDVQAENSRLHFIKTNYEGSPFEGKALCEQDLPASPSFNSFDVLNVEYSFHPNSNGQSAFHAVMFDHILAK